jgi:hypothetical protein
MLIFNDVDRFTKILWTKWASALVGSSLIVVLQFVISDQGPFLNIPWMWSIICITHKWVNLRFFHWRSFGHIQSPFGTFWKEVLNTPHAHPFEHLSHKFIIDAPLACPHNMQHKSQGIITSDIFTCPLMFCKWHNAQVCTWSFQIYLSWPSKIITLNGNISWI